MPHESFEDAVDEQNRAIDAWGRRAGIVGSVVAAIILLITWRRSG